jgi:HPt (histidine-containing phosphotransfer) domain-containing protein
MDDYQTKPFDTEKMVRLIRRYVGMAKGVPVPVREKQGKRPEGVEWPAIEGIESEGVRERINDDLELFMDLLKRFTDENRSLLQPVVLPSEQGEREVLLARMHKLAGSAGLVGAMALSGLARRVENSLRNGDQGEISTLLDQLREGFCQLDKAIGPALQHYKEDINEDEPVVLTSVELDELREALQQKKISAMKIYRKLRSALRPLMDGEAFEELEKSMEKLDFAVAHTWLAQLGTSPATIGSTRQAVKG